MVTQEPVAQLKRDYMATIDDLAPVLGEEGIQEVCCLPLMQIHVLQHMRAKQAQWPPQSYSCQLRARCSYRSAAGSCDGVWSMTTPIGIRSPFLTDMYVSR